MPAGEFGGLAGEGGDACCRDGDGAGAVVEIRDTVEGGGARPDEDDVAPPEVAVRVALVDVSESIDESPLEGRGAEFEYPRRFLVGAANDDGARETSGGHGGCHFVEGAPVGGTSAYFAGFALDEEELAGGFGFYLFEFEGVAAGGGGAVEGESAAEGVLGGGFFFDGHVGLARVGEAFVFEDGARTCLLLGAGDAEGAEEDGDGAVFHGVSIIVDAARMAGYGYSGGGDCALPPSSSGPGLRPFKPPTGVRVPLGAPVLLKRGDAGRLRSCW